MANPSNTIQLMDQLQLFGETNTIPKVASVQLPVSSSFRDWAGLLPELLDFVVTNIGRLSDYIHFGGVCSQWRSAALTSDSCHKQSLTLLKASRKKVPMLMFKTEEHNSDTRGLYSFRDGMTYNLMLPRPCRHRFFGSSYGWLFCYNESRVVTLLNPLSNKCIYLPSFSESLYEHWSILNDDYFLQKGILSADPLVSPDSFTVAVIYSGMCKLVVYKSGDLHWEYIDLQPERNYVFSDILFYKNNLYGVAVWSNLVLIDTGTQRGETIVPEDNDESRGYSVTYLVESVGELLLIQRFWVVEGEGADENEEEDEDEDEDEGEDHDDRVFNPSEYYSTHRTNNFKIFKLMQEKETTNWVQIYNIGNQALFIGDNHSLSISTAECPECLPNSIYYTSHFYFEIGPNGCCGPDEDSGIFRLEDGSSHSHRLLDFFEWYTEPNVWFVPNPDLTSFT